MNNPEIVNQIENLTESILANEIKGQDAIEFIKNESVKINDSDIQAKIEKLISLLECETFYYKGSYAVALNVENQTFLALPESKAKDFLDLR